MMFNRYPSVFQDTSAKFRLAADLLYPTTCDLDIGFL
jgi:hypothetical protein